MKANVVPSANPGTIRIPKLKKGSNSKLVFKKIHNPMWFEVEIVYAEKSLGKYATNNFNEIILLFFEKLAKYNNGTAENVETKLDRLEKNYLTDKNSVDKQVQNAENFSNKDDLINQILQSNTSYPLEYNDDEVNNIIGLTEKQNIIRRTLEEQNLLMKDLASAIGINVNTLRSQASKNDVPSQTKKSIELYIENIQLKKELNKYRNNT